MTPRRGVSGLTVVLSAVALLLSSGCTSGPSSVGRAGPVRPAPSTTVRATPPQTLAPPPPVQWVPCQNGLQCGTVPVPLDYSDPSGSMLQIAVARRPALVRSARIGSLVINPGGPGDSGIDDLPNELRVLTSGLQDDFDVVSFDPRGVERSAPVHCVQGTGAASGPLPDPAPTSGAAQQALLAGTRAFVQDCVRNSGPVLGHVGTVDTARDLDRIREAIGDSRLTYIGHSYGTFLGAVYADLFPDRVRAMVLDGAVDPAIDLEQMSLDQARGYDASFLAFARWCGGDASCPWHPGADPVAAYLDLASRLRSSPLAVAGGRTAGVGELHLATLATLTARSFWPSLGQALYAAARGDGAPLLTLSDRYQVHGGPNTSDAETAIDCLDRPTGLRPQDYPSAAGAAASVAPLFGPSFAWSSLVCSVWPFPPRRPAPTRAAGAPPIVVVGTTDDPATPYSWAQHLAAELGSGVLVTRQGADHVAYYYSACVRGLDEAYLVRGVVPASGTVCPS